MSVSQEIKGFLPLTVKDKNDSLARQARTQIKQHVEEVKGKLEKFEVYQGDIFVNVDSEAASTSVIEMFKKIASVTVEVLDPLQAIYRKGLLKVADETAKSAA